MTLANEELTHYASRLRVPTPSNVKEDKELMDKGILDEKSFISGYEFHNHPVEIKVFNPDGDLKAIRRTHNIRTNAGGTDQAANMSGAGSVAVAKYIGLSNDANTTPHANDQYLQATSGNTGASTELTTGFSTTARPAATYTLSTISGTGTSTVPGTYTLQATWTANTTITGIQKCGVFNSATQPTAGTPPGNLGSFGDLWFEATFTSVGLNNGDSLQLTYTINF